MQNEQDYVTESHVQLVDLGEVEVLTLGEGGSGSEDKRHQYN